MSGPNPATTEWVPIWNSAYEGPAGPPGPAGELPTAALGQVVISQGVGTQPVFSPDPKVTTLTLGTNPAQSGAVRLPDNAEIKTRNAANTDDYRLILGSANQVHIGQSTGVSTYINGANVLLTAGTANYNFDSTGIYPGADNTRAIGHPSVKFAEANIGTSVNVGTNPATTGALRLANNTGIYARSADSLSNIRLLGTDTGNNILMGDGVINFFVYSAGLNLFASSYILLGVNSINYYLDGTVFRPNSTTNAQDIGSSVNKWKDAHFAGNVNAGGLGSTPLNATNLTTGTVTDARLSVNVLKYTGGYPGGTTNFLRADGTFAAPTSAVALHKTTHQTGGTDIVDVKLLGGYPGDPGLFLSGMGTFNAPTVPANIAYTNVANTFTANQTINGQILKVSSIGGPRLQLYPTDGTVDARKWEMLALGTEIWIQCINDAETFQQAIPLKIFRDGNVTVSGSLAVGGGANSIDLFGANNASRYLNFRPALADAGENMGIKSIPYASSNYDALQIGASGGLKIKTAGGTYSFANTGEATIPGALVVAGTVDITGGSGTSYDTAPIEIRMTSHPRVGFHWYGVVASSIGMDNTGVIRTYNNPGTGYERFACADLTTNGTATINANLYTNTVHNRNGYPNYPGRVDVGADGGYQASWYLGSHASYGLYSNTGFQAANFQATGGLYDYSRGNPIGVWIDAAPSVAGAVVNTNYAYKYTLIGKTMLFYFYLDVSVVGAVQIGIPAGYTSTYYAAGYLLANATAGMGQVTPGGNVVNLYLSTTGAALPGGNYPIVGQIMFQIP